MSIKFFKKLKKSHVSSYDITKELNIDHKICVKLDTRSSMFGCHIWH